MKLQPPQKLKDIAQLIHAKYEGKENHIISGLNEIHKVEKGDLVFVDKEKYYEKALQSNATTILINKKVKCPEGKALIFSEHPFRDFNRLITCFYSFEKSHTLLSTSSKIGKHTHLQPNVFIGNHVTIGKNCVIHSNVTIYDHCVIGNNVVIHANTVIGADGFYYKNTTEGYVKLISCGRVVIEDDVEIGALSSIDRGVTGDTLIGKGTKIDNQVQIGHDTVIGKNCLFAAQVGIAGAVVIEDNVTLWGQVGIPSGITIGKGAVVLAQSGVHKSLEGNKTYFGSPAEEARKKMKELAMIKRLPEIFEKR